jgi:hypothetical protein
MDEKKLYSAIEATIMRWVLDGTKTAGSLTREIMLIIKQQDNYNETYANDTTTGLPKEDSKRRAWHR